MDYHLTFIGKYKTQTNSYAMGILCKEIEDDKISATAWRKGFSFQLTTEKYPSNPKLNMIITAGDSTSGLPQYMRNGYTAPIWYSWDGHCIKEENESEYHDFYISFSMDNNIHELIIYVNGKEVMREIYDENYFSSVLDYINNPNIPFEFGRCYHSNGTGEGGNPKVYYKGEIYSCRLYNRGLTAEEMLANYNATVSYHNILVNNGNASTGGETGGEDFDNIETN